MNVNGLSNVSNNYNTNNLNKAKNSPSFGALRADAADMFVQKATEAGKYWGQKNQNSFLQGIVKLAERAKQSLVLDIGAKVDDEKAVLELIDATGRCKKTTLPYKFLGFEQHGGEPSVAISAKTSGDIPAGFEKEEPYLHNATYGYASVKDFVNSLIEAFNKKEAEIVDQIETDKVTKSLQEQLKKLVHEEF